MIPIDLRLSVLHVLEHNTFKLTGVLGSNAVAESGFSVQSLDVSNFIVLPCLITSPPCNCIHRWARHARLLFDSVQYYAYLRFDSTQSSPSGPVPPPSDFTIISVTMGTQHNYARNAQSWLACNPMALVIVTNDRYLSQVQALAKSLANRKVHVYSVPESGWRPVGREGIRHTKSPYLVFVDDDVIWGAETLGQIAHAFADSDVGGVNTIQEVYPSGLQFTLWETFGALNLVRRNILHSFLAYFRDGEVLNLSGRTAGYQTKILQQEELYSAITDEYWRGQHRINTGDDNFFTSWVVRRGWKTRFVNQKEAAIATYVNNDASYLQQLMRWSRDTARNYLLDLDFATRTHRWSLLTHYVYKTVANYASDIAVVGELGLLLMITASRKMGMWEISTCHPSL